MNIICTVCKKPYTYKRGRNSHIRCGSCCANNRRFKLKIKMVEYKGGKCNTRGYNKNLAALTFHHLDVNEKEFTISGSHCKSWESIKNELNKCICLCFNCHMEIHNEKLNHWRSSE